MGPHKMDKDIHLDAIDVIDPEHAVFGLELGRRGSTAGLRHGRGSWRPDGSCNHSSLALAPAFYSALSGGQLPGEAMGEDRVL